MKPRLISAYAREKLKGIGRTEANFFFNSEICCPFLTQCARDDRVHIRKRVSTGYSGWVFIREAPAPSEYVYTCITSGACMPRVAELHAMLVHFCPSVWVCVCVRVRMCVCVSLYAPNDDPSLFSPATQPASGMRRDFTPHMRVMHEYSSVIFECTNRVILSSFGLRLSRVHINTCLWRAFIRTGLLTAPVSRDRDRN